MDKNILRAIQKIFFKKDIKVPEMMSLILAENFNEFINIIKDFIDNNYQELFDLDDFFNDYHIFLYELSYQNMDNIDNVYLIKYLIDSTIKLLKEKNKEYNKNIISKDEVYYRTCHIIKDLESNLDVVENIIDDSYENKDFQIIWFIITTLKNPDHLYRILELYPEKANITNMNKESLFKSLVDYYLSRLNSLSEDDIKYYKRVFVLLLESDELKISNNELITILFDLETNIAHAKGNKKLDISFLANEINEHYSIINTDSRQNALSYLNRFAPTILRDGKKNRKRVDLTDLFTISIDTVNPKSLSNLLVDDAYSIVKNSDGSFILYIHIPDVDHFVKKDSPTDKFMRGLGDSVYFKNYRTPLINPEISQNMSLKQGNVRPAITFILKIDANGKVLDIDFKETLVNVNYNFSASSIPFKDPRVIETFEYL